MWMSNNLMNVSRERRLSPTFSLAYVKVPINFSFAAINSRVLNKRHALVIKAPLVMWANYLVCHLSKVSACRNWYDIGAISVEIITSLSLTIFFHITWLFLQISASGNLSRSAWSSLAYRKKFISWSPKYVRSLSNRQCITSNPPEGGLM